MKTVFFSVLILVFWALSISATSAQSGIVTRKKNLLGFYKYHKNGQKLSEKEFLKVLEPYPQSYNLMQSARKNYLWGNIAGFTGSLLVFSQLSPSNPYHKKDPAIIIPGLVLFGTGLPLSIKYIRQSALAMDLYNEAQAAKGFSQPNPE